MDWSQFVMAVCAVVGILGAAGAALVKVGMEIAKLRREVTPNGGTTQSLGDRVTRIEAMQHTQSASLQRIELSLERLPCHSFIKKCPDVS